MAIFRCKMCGGDLEIIENASSCTCDFCGTKQTIPTVKDENLQGLFNRANVLRMKSEFDKAEEIYEKILQSSSTEAEAYWGLILCKYGIEYVEDPASFKRVPTCHRASYDAITADVDYKNALQYADVQQKLIYEAEAKEIEEVQKGIMALVANEEPYDVFICYKETDESGKRTQDSVIANDIYYQLTQEGFKVFYAAITLEDKLGTEYEPYIFSALNTAKVMLSIGTKPEYFNAVWVKNEWSRFLKIMKKDRSKMLIPCYRDMDAYELPEEFAHLQAQDMSKIGFINDIVRGIKKIVVKEDVNQQVVQQTVIQQAAPVSSNIQALLDRGNMAIEDDEWEKADEFFEEVLNQDAKCAEAYLGKLMSKCKRSNVPALIQYYVSKYDLRENEKLEACKEATDRIETAIAKYTVSGYLSDSEIRKHYVFNRDYVSQLSFRKRQKSLVMSELSEEKLFVRAQQYAVGETKNLVDKVLEDITRVYDERISAAEQADKESTDSVKNSYEKHLSETDEKVKELYNNALERQEVAYNSGVFKMNAAETISDYEIVRDLFKNMYGYKDTDELANKCQSEIDRLKEEKRLEEERLEAIRREEAERQIDEKREKTKKVIITLSGIVACIAVLVVVTKVIIPSNKYNNARKMFNSGKYEEAIAIFEDLNGFKDSSEQIKLCEYKEAVELMNGEKYEEALVLFGKIDTYRDSKKLSEECENNVLCKKIEDAINEEQYDEVKKLYNSFGRKNIILDEFPNLDIMLANVNDVVCFANTDWIVLDKTKEKALVIKKRISIREAYNEERSETSWEKCTLRYWLNNDYINSEFNENERKFIIESDNDNVDNETFGSVSGKSTKDKIFILSTSEANNYFIRNALRVAKDDKDNKNSWWLRTSGDKSIRAAYIGDDGVTYRNGVDVNVQKGVRPAMWIDISKLD